MSNEHVREPFRSILASILRPVEQYPLPVEISTRQQPKTRFHPDDIETALNVLLMYWPAHQDARNSEERIREAFSRCMVTLDKAMTERREEELERQYEYEQWRKSQPAVEYTMLHDSDTDPGGAK